MKRFLSLAVASMLVLATLVGCGGNKTSAPAQNDASSTEQKYSGKVMLYSSMQEEQLQAVKEAFEKKYPGVTMDFYFASGGKVITKMTTEAQAGQIDADII